MFRESFLAYREGLRRCLDELSPEKLECVAQILLRAQRKGGQVFFLGNGGSASTAAHMAVDLGKGCAVNGRGRFRAISLADSVCLLTRWANDAGYEAVFVEQLKALLKPQDVVVALSASGNSPNVLRAVEFARQRGATTVGLIGFGGGKLKDLVDIDITLSSRNYGQVEDVHLVVNHILTQYLRHRMTQESATEAVEVP
jgi:D-sedoheptulose 7-phosphate isomerase